MRNNALIVSAPHLGSIMPRPVRLSSSDDESSIAQNARRDLSSKREYHGMPQLIASVQDELYTLLTQEPQTTAPLAPRVRPPARMQRPTTRDLESALSIFRVNESGSLMQTATKHTQGSRNGNPFRGRKWLLALGEQKRPRKTRSP